LALGQGNRLREWFEEFVASYGRLLRWGLAVLFALWSVEGMARGELGFFWGYVRF
jgi:hypothetical protein